MKRRIRAVGAFPDRASALRLITAILLQATAIWTDRSYVDVSLLAPQEVARQHGAAGGTSGARKSETTRGRLREAPRCEHGDRRPFGKRATEGDDCKLG